MSKNNRCPKLKVLIWVRSLESTFEKDEDEVGDDYDEEDVLILLSSPRNIFGSSVPLLTFGFTFIDDHSNLLNRHIDSLTTLVNGLVGLLHEVLAQQNALNAHLTQFFLL